MKDIRIFTGRAILPEKESVYALLGQKVSMHELESLYEKLLPIVKMHIRPKAAFTIKQKKACAILTLGSSITRLIEKYTVKDDLLSATLVDAMADSCRFAFEKQLLHSIGQICIEEGFGVKKRLEISTDIPIEEQKTACELLEAERTLGVTLTSSYMLNPVKSMSLFFELTEDTSCQNLKHDCSKCTNETCMMRKKEEIILRIKAAQEKSITCQRGSRLMEVLQKNKLLENAPCGGNGKCKKCRILVQQGNLPITEADKMAFSNEELQKGMRLACQAVLTENLTIALPTEQNRDFYILLEENMQILADFVHNTYEKDSYGIAIDIGTTTLAFLLVELQTGKVISQYSQTNSQRCYGADVISRIEASNAGKKEQLCQCIKADIQKGICALLKNKERNMVIRHIAIAANTTMLHLLRGYSCNGLSAYPFSPENLHTEEISVTELLCTGAEIPQEDEHLQLPMGISSQTKVTLLSGISAFVGADITAGLYACGIEDKEENSLFLDIGTNGEMALKAGNKIYVASTAAGPAFEGGNIEWGIGSIAGAIAKVHLQNERALVQTIQGEPPTGICGTGVIEITAELLKHDIVDKSGKLAEPYF